MRQRTFFCWYRILRVHYNWGPFQAFRFALWLVS